MKTVIVDICTMCNAKCKYCMHQYRNMISGKIMSKEIFYKIIDILRKEEYLYMYPYLSGEPLLHPFYWEFMSAASKDGIFTNTASKLCCNIDKKDKEDMKTTFSSLSSPMRFEITIDADNQDTQDKISKNINIDQVFENLKVLVSVAEGMPVYILVITVVNAFNEDRLPKIIERVNKCGVKNWHPKAIGYYMGYAMRQEDVDIISEMEPKKISGKRFYVKNGVLISNKSTCGGTFIRPVIGFDGQVTICCHDMLYSEAIWNVLDTGSLDIIINSDEFKKKLNLARNMKLPICKGCN